MLEKVRGGTSGLCHRLIECPACGKKLPPGAGKKVSEHIATHDPEDFGLSPLREPEKVPGVQ